MSTQLYLKFNKTNYTDLIISSLIKVNQTLEDIEEMYYEDDDGISCTIGAALTGQESLNQVKQFCDHLKNILPDNNALHLQFDIQDKQPHSHTRLQLEHSLILKSLAHCSAGLQFIAFPYYEIKNSRLCIKTKSSRRNLESFFLIDLSIRGVETQCPLWGKLAQEDLSEGEHIDFIEYKGHHFILLSWDVMSSYNAFIKLWLKHQSIGFKDSDYSLLQLSYFMGEVYTEVTMDSDCLSLLNKAKLSLNIDIHKSFFINEADMSPMAQVARYILSSKKWKKRIGVKD